MDVSVIALIMKVLLSPFLVLMTVRFYKLYKQTNNQYFNGYFIFFLMVSISWTVITLAEIMMNLGYSYGEFLITTSEFPNYEENRDKLGLIRNLVRPNYIPIFIIVFIAFASQIQPLEVLLNQEKRIVSRFLYVLVGLFLLIYIPSLTYTLYTVIIVWIGLIAIFVAFVYNVGISFKLIITGVGDIRKRAGMVLSGFMIFLIGLIWSMKVGWSRLLNPEWNYDYDVIFGTILIFISLYFYMVVFKMDSQ